MSARDFLLWTNELHDDGMGRWRFLLCLGTRRPSYGADAVALWTGVWVSCHGSIPCRILRPGGNMSYTSLCTEGGSFYVNEYNRCTC